MSKLKRICVDCDSRKTYSRPDGSNVWRLKNNKCQCMKCWSKDEWQRRKKDPQYLKKKRVIDKEYRDRPKIKEKQKKYIHNWLINKRKNPEFIESERIRAIQYYRNGGKEVSNRRLNKNKLLNRKDILSLSEINLRYYRKKFKLYGNLFNLSCRGYGHALENWSISIKQRDDYTCQNCDIIKLNKYLVAHHLIYKSYMPLISLNMNNGITLCVPCHKELHYGVKGGDV